MEEWPLDSDEEVAGFCEICGQVYYDCTCSKAQCLEKNLQRVDLMVKNGLKKRIREKQKQLLFKQKNKSMQKLKYDEDVNALVKIMMNKLGVSSLEAFYYKLCSIYGAADNNELAQTLQRIYGTYNTNLKAAKDFIERYDQLIAGQDAKNNEVLQSQAGKKTNKRVAAPITDDDNSATPRTISKTMEVSNIYQELKEQGKKPKFIAGPANTLGFKDEVAQNKRTQKNIEKNQDLEKRNLRQRKL